MLMVPSLRVSTLSVALLRDGSWTSRLLLSVMLPSGSFCCRFWSGGLGKIVNSSSESTTLMVGSSLSTLMMAAGVEEWVEPAELRREWEGVLVEKLLFLGLNFMVACSGLILDLTENIRKVLKTF